MGAGEFPALPPALGVGSLAAGAWTASRTPLPVSGAVRHPNPPARWHSWRGGAKRQLSCSHFLIVVFEAPGSRAEPLSVPALRLLEVGVASDEGGATPRRGGEGALGGGAAGPAAARECGTSASCAAGPEDERASQPSGRRGWRPGAASPNLITARRHGASAPDGPVSIPGGQRVGLACLRSTAGSRTRGIRGW